jgi:hypothetical protein
MPTIRTKDDNEPEVITTVSRTRQIQKKKKKTTITLLSFMPFAVCFSLIIGSTSGIGGYEFGQLLKNI